MKDLHISQMRQALLDAESPDLFFDGLIAIANIYQFNKKDWLARNIVSGKDVLAKDILAHMKESIAETEEEKQVLDVYEAVIYKDAKLSDLQIEASKAIADKYIEQGKGAFESIGLDANELDKGVDEFRKIKNKIEEIFNATTTKKYKGIAFRVMERAADESGYYAAMEKLEAAETDDEKDNARSELDAAKKVFLEKYQELASEDLEVKELKNKLEELQDKYVNPIEEFGGNLLKKLLENPKMYEQESDKWVSEYTNIKQTHSRNKEYPYAEIAKDLSEFMMIAGAGRINSVVFSKTRATRAFTDSPADGFDSEISLNAGDRKNTVFHELGHNLEVDPKALVLAHGFIAKRRESSKLHRLSDLTNLPYESNEVAYKGNFINPYMGKYYDSGITEVWAMAIEHFHSPRSLGLLAAKDPELLAMVLGYLQDSDNRLLSYMQGINEIQLAKRRIISDNKERLKDEMVKRFNFSMADFEFNKEEIDKIFHEVANYFAGRPYVVAKDAKLKVLGVDSKNINDGLVYIAVEISKAKLVTSRWKRTFSIVQAPVGILSEDVSGSIKVIASSEESLRDAISIVRI